MRYDMLHVTPPQGPLDVVAQSALANQDGWVTIDTEVGGAPPCVTACSRHARQPAAPTASSP